MQLRHLKPIHIAVKNAIITPKKQLTNFIFMTKLAYSILKESQKLKRSG